MIYESVQRYESGFSAVLSKRVEGGYSIRLNNHDDVEVMHMTVEGATAPPADIAETMEAAYRAGHDDGAHEMRERIRGAIEGAWRGSAYGT